MKEVTQQKAKKLLATLLGLSVSRAWTSVDGVVYLELGELQPAGPGRREQGLAWVRLYWWRIEFEDTVELSCWTEGLHRREYLENLHSSKIGAISMEGSVFDLRIELSDGRTVLGFAGIDDAWRVRLKNDTYLVNEFGSLCVSLTGVPHMTIRERKMWAAAEDTTDRWGMPRVDPAHGSCDSCRWRASFEGMLGILNYGVCAIPLGPLDGRVVGPESGCPMFSRRKAQEDGSSRR